MNTASGSIHLQQNSRIAFTIAFKIVHYRHIKTPNMKWAVCSAHTMKTKWEETKYRKYVKEINTEKYKVC